MDLEKVIENLTDLKERLKWQKDIQGYGIYIDFIEDALELLKEQEIVRCKDCKFWFKDECSHLCKITGDLHPANWFCADGERKQEDDNTH